MNELKPCECGRPAKMQDAKIIDGKATRWFARCESAYCWYGPERDSRERAAESWNRRMSPEAHAEAGYCERHPDTKIIDHSLICGAPHCCPKCCYEADKEAHAEAVERPTEFSVPDTIAERVDRVMREARLKVREYLAKESANLKPLDLNQVYGTRPALAALPAGLGEEDLRRLAIYSVATCDINGGNKRDRPAILLEQAIAALALVEGEKK